MRRSELPPGWALMIYIHSGAFAVYISRVAARNSLYNLSSQFCEMPESKKKRIEALGRKKVELEEGSPLCNACTEKIIKNALTLSTESDLFFFSLDSRFET